MTVPRHRSQPSSLADQIDDDDRPSRVCSWSSFSPTTSKRRNPHPRSNPRIAPSRQPRRSVFEAAFTNACALFRVSQLPLFRPSCLLP